MAIKSMVLFAGLFIGLAVACSSGPEESATAQDNSSSSNGPSTGISAASFDTCSGLLVLEDIQTIAGRSDIKLGEPNVNSGAQSALGSGIKTMCIYEYVTPEIVIGGSAQLRQSGPAMTLIGMSFESGESAAAHYQIILAGTRGVRDTSNLGSEVTEGVIGQDSYIWTIDAQQLGSVTGFLAGPYIVQFHTTLPDGQEPLMTPQDLVTLGGSVLNRLAIL